MNIPRKRKRSLLSRIAPWALLGLAVFFVSGFIAVRIWFFAYLKSDAFRHLIGSLTSKQIKANGEYQQFNFSDNTIYSDGFKAQGTAEAPFSNLQADQLRAQINLAGLWNRAWQIDQIDIERLQLALGHADYQQLASQPEQVPEEQAPEEPSASPSMPWSRWLPNHVDLRKVVIHDTNLKWSENTPRAGAINNAEFTITPGDNGAWNILCDSGTLAQQGQPDLVIDQANLSYKRPTLYITDATLRYNSDSTIGLSGQVDFGKNFDVRANLNNINVSPLLQPDWKEKLKGNLSGTVEVNSPLPMAGGPNVSGTLHLSQGEIEALPVLDEIAIFTSTERFRRVNLTKVNIEFTRTDSLLDVTKLIAESEGLIRVEGHFTVQNGIIDGTFDVGVATSSMELLNAALQNKVFTSTHGGYVWTTMHLTGPVDHPSEDLSKRLVAAMAGTVIDTGSNLINQVPGGDAVTGEGKKLIDTFLSPLIGN